MSEDVVPDALSDWVMPPPSARDVRPIRVFDTVEAAIVFLELLLEDAQRAQAEAA